MSNHDKTSGRSARKAGAFDIRSFIAMLIGVYGLVLLFMGLFGTSEEDLAKADGLNINLWAGIGMAVVAAAFQAWAMMRPIVIPPDFQTVEDDDRPGRGH